MGGLVAFTPAQAATFVQTANGTKLASAGSPTSVSATFSSGAGAGDMLIAVVSANGNATITGPSGWSSAINEAGTVSQGIFYTTATGSETAVSASVSSNPGSIGIHIYEYAGVTSLMSSSSSTGHSTAPASGSVTTTVSNELVLAGFVLNNNTSITNSSWSNGSEGFTERSDFGTSGPGSPPDATYAGGDNLSNAAGAQSVAVAVASGGSADWRGQIVRF